METPDRESTPGAAPPGPPEDHPERDFILRALLLIGAILLVKPLVMPWMGLIALLFPLVFFIGLRLHAIAQDRDPNELLNEHLTITPFVVPERDRRYRGADWVTYGLIATNVAIFYGIQPVLGWEFIGDHLVFAPMEPNAWNVPVSAVSAMFLHGSPGHLWGNMIFLWALGSVVERRLSRRTFILAYLGTGLAAGLISLGVGWFFMGGVIHGLGASGAIAGLMGIFVVRCYFKTMIFPLPILGIFSLIVPLAVKVRLNSMVVIGLFFFADLSGGIGQITGTSFSNVGHWAHIGGMLAGLAVARRLELHREAVVERHIDIGERGLDDPYAKAGEESLRRVLASHPDNWEATLLLARTLSRPHRSDEGGTLFRRAIRGLLAQSPGEAAEAFREYYGLYLRGVDPAIDLRLARIFGGNGDSELASRCLESVVRDANAAPELREKAMYQLAVTLKGLGHDEAALDYFGEFLQTFPDSPLAPKVRSRMGTL